MKKNIVAVALFIILHVLILVSLILGISICLFSLVCVLISYSSVVKNVISLLTDRLRWKRSLDVYNNLILRDLDCHSHHHYNRRILRTSGTTVVRLLPSVKVENKAPYNSKVACVEVRFLPRSCLH